MTPVKVKYPEHIPGTRDYIGVEAQRLIRVGDVCSATYDRYGYERIILPILERADIFLERSGEEIRNRMYILRDPRGREICLRPEMTISAARAFLERMPSRRLPVRLSYQGDMFRYDDVREGRYREFVQSGVEFIGSENRVAADVEILAMALEAVSSSGVSNLRLLLGDLALAEEFINSLPVKGSVRARLFESFWRRDAFELLLKELDESSAGDNRGKLRHIDILRPRSDKNLVKK